jgi:hypothetical protein
MGLNATGHSKFAVQINPMKHALLLALLSPVALFSQLPFDLTVLDQPYTPLLESTALETSQYDYPNGWDDPEFSVPPGSISTTAVTSSMPSTRWASAP